MILLIIKGIDVIMDYLVIDVVVDWVSVVVDMVLCVIEGFEGLYGVELFVSMYWVVICEGVKELVMVVVVV